MKNRKTVLISSGVLVALLFSVSAFLLLRDSTSNTEINGSHITVSGEYVCLPHKNSNQTTEECALGIKADNGSYYAIKANDNDLNDFQSGKRVTISGEYQPETSQTYTSVGTVILSE